MYSDEFTLKKQGRPAENPTQKCNFEKTEIC